MEHTTRENEKLGEARKSLERRGVPETKAERKDKTVIISPRKEKPKC